MILPAVRSFGHRFMDDIGTPALGAVAIHTMAIRLRLGTTRSASRLPCNDRLGPGPGPGNTVLLPRGPFRGYCPSLLKPIFLNVYLYNLEKTGNFHTILLYSTYWLTE